MQDITYEDAIKSVKIHFSYPTGRLSETGKFITDCIEKQIPENTIIENCEDIGVVLHYCPRCKERLKISHIAAKVCSCGQKLKFKE